MEGRAWGRTPRRGGRNHSTPSHLVSETVARGGGVLPAVQMPVQPSLAPDGSGARFGIIVVAEPEPDGAPCCSPSE